MIKKKSVIIKSSHDIDDNTWGIIHRLKGIASMIGHSDLIYLCEGLRNKKNDERYYVFQKLLETLQENYNAIEFSPPSSSRTMSTSSGVLQSFLGTE